MKLKTISLFLAATFLTGACVFAQSAADPKERVRLVRDLSKKSEDGIADLATYVRDPATEVRLEVVKQLNQIGGPRTIPSLIPLSADTDPEIQIHAVDGLINVFLPGYLKNGVARSITRSNDQLRVKFVDNTQVVDGYIIVPPEVVGAVTNVLTTSKSLESRANAARALGIFRAQAAVAPLGQALYSKDDQLMFESLIALQKIRDASAGPSVAFLVRDLNEKIQIAALRTAGILRAKPAAANIRSVIDDGPNKRVLREAASTLAMIADPPDRGIFLGFLTNSDMELRASAAEGLARIRNPTDLARLEKAFNDEREFGPRLAFAFALVSLGRLEVNETSPFRYLVNAFDRNTFRAIALAYFTELARDPAVRQTLYPTLARATSDEKTGLCVVLGESGDRDSVRYLTALKDDTDVAVSQVCLSSLRTLQARLQ
ncbi:MAG: HEAT repeat domain-containing protein [Acidobacteriota bacterium]